MQDEADGELPSELANLGIRDILEQDSRPTFVLDLDPDDLDSTSNASAISPVFCNAALRSHDRLLDAVIGEVSIEVLDGGDAPQHEEFKSWATGITKFDDSRDIFPLSFLYSGMLWTGSTVRKRWRLISGNLCYDVSSLPSRNLSSVSPVEVPPGGSRVAQTVKTPSASLGTPCKFNILLDGDSQADVSHPASNHLTDYRKDISKTTPSSSDRQMTSNSKTSDQKPPSGSSKDTSSTTSVSLAGSRIAVSDWTSSKPKGVLSPHLAFARSVDWASTPLGPLDSWSPEFRQIANLVMANPHPASLFWGEELTMMYNAAYGVEVAGHKHPALMGTGFQGPFAELWNDVGPVFVECARTGISARKENQYLPMERHGYLEETYFSWSFTPLFGEGSQILGFYNAPFETTQHVIGSRRRRTLRTLDEKLSLATTMREFWKCVLEGLEDNHFDVPLALLYSVSENDDGDESSQSSGSNLSMKSCMFEGSIGIPEGHPAAPQQLDLKRSREGFVPSFREAMRTREPTKLQTRDGSLPEVLLEGVHWRGFESPCREAIIFPVRPTNGETVLAFLLLGVNPRRAYDDEYKAFTTMLNRQLATSLASVILFETEIRRSRNAAEVAAAQQEQLTQQLAVQTSRLRRMTELSPLGMYLMDSDGVLQEANDRYYEMTGHPREKTYKMSFLEPIMEKSKPVALAGWHKLTVDGLPWSDEIQLRRLGVDPVDSKPIDYWVLATSMPEFAPDGSVKSITGSITDISHLKWAEGLQNQRLREAEETRRQQNEFIDITSHEMRNPLSAILQCADDVSSSLNEYHSKAMPPPAKVIEDCIEAANTIVLCVQHQKSIVDDILTISKLDSNLLVITPSVVQPVAVARRAVKMLDPELQAKDIEINFHEHHSLKEFQVDWVALDPSRLLQVLINLMTNAIKFTQAATKRLITITVGASIGPPDANTPDFHYIPLRNASATAALGEDWGTGEILYLRFKVADTGCGLNADEKQLLFKRFSQASHRTHAQYGGSGLGLFISRQLAELHGGQIGVASESGVGSTFGFFIKARRAEPPRNNVAKAMLNDVLDEVVAPQRRELATSRPGATLAATKVATELNPKDLCILVVEDNLVNQKVLRKQLQKAGCTVAVADDGVEALEYLAKTEFHIKGGEKLSVILMDLEMPLMDGLTCVRNIRAMERDNVICKHVPVIAVTANVRAEQVAAARESGMDDVVSKPFRVPELLAKIELLLRD